MTEASWSLVSPDILAMPRTTWPAALVSAWGGAEELTTSRTCSMLQTALSRAYLRDAAVRVASIGSSSNAAAMEAISSRGA